MKNNDIANIVIAIGGIYFGVKLLLYTGAYSYKSRMYVQFVPSPIKDIVGIFAFYGGCILAM